MGIGIVELHDLLGSLVLSMLPMVRWILYLMNKIDKLKQMKVPRQLIGPVQLGGFRLSKGANNSLIALAVNGFTDKQ